jgi:class 3 adenylate cyclase
LFADIKGSMELIEDLDPEEARRLVDPALELMMDAVHRYEGYVAQSTGDAIFALFGAPHACTERCDVLVCADGINSAGRRLLLPEIRPRYAGYVAWRGRVAEHELSTERLVSRGQNDGARGRVASPQQQPERDEHDNPCQDDQGDRDFVAAVHQRSRIVSLIRSNSRSEKASTTVMSAAWRD